MTSAIPDHPGRVGVCPGKVIKVNPWGVDVQTPVIQDDGTPVVLHFDHNGNVCDSDGKTNDTLGNKTWHLEQDGERRTAGDVKRERPRPAEMEARKMAMFGSIEEYMKSFRLAYMISELELYIRA